MNLDKFNILTFGKGNFVTSQNKLKEHLNNLGLTKQIHLTDDDLPLEFKEQFKHIFNHKKGYGYCIWKPYIISNFLKKIKNDEILIYLDSTDLPEKKFFEFIGQKIENCDNVFINRGYIHGEWTKRDTFVLMNCDNDFYHQHVQLEAGVMALRPTDFNLNLIKEWLYYCGNENILTEIPNTCNSPNLIGFKEHRYDQSILTNLIIKYKLKSYLLDDSIIKYNFNQPLFYS